MATQREEAIVELGLSTTKLDQRISAWSTGFKAKLSGFAHEFGTALAGGGIIAGIEKILSHFDDLKDRADNLDIGTDFMQGLQQLARQDAVGGVKAFDLAIAQLSVNLGNAKQGAKDAVDKFEKWGISLAQIQSLNTEEVFYLIADRIKEIPDAAERSAVAFELFGKSGKNLTGILSQGADAIGEFVKHVDKLDAEKVKQLAAAKDELESLTNTLTVWGGKGIAALREGFELLGKLSVGNMEGQMDTAARQKLLADAKTAAAELQKTKDIEQAYRDEIAKQDEQRNDKIAAAEKKASDEQIKILEKRSAEMKRIKDKEAKDSEERIQKQMKMEKAFREGLAAALKGYDTSIHSEFLPGLDELATKGIYQQDARRLQFLQRDAVDAALYGDKEGREADLREIQDIRDRLSAAGVYNDPNKEVLDQLKNLVAYGDGKSLRVKVEMYDSGET